MNGCFGVKVSNKSAYRKEYISILKKLGELTNEYSLKEYEERIEGNFKIIIIAVEALPENTIDEIKQKMYKHCEDVFKNVEVPVDQFKLWADYSDLNNA